jgi:spore maturation protein CgeB
MRILLYGEFWPGTHVDCISRALQDRNVEFKIFDFFKILNQSIGNRLLNKIGRAVFYSQREKLINQLLINEIDIFKPDVLLISKGVNIYPDSLLRFKRASILIINWNPDDFFNKKNSTTNLLNSLDLYDIVFSARKHLFDEYQASGIKKPLYLEWYYIPWLHKKPYRELPVEAKISFIGTHSKRREDIIKSISKDFKIEIWGAGWQLSLTKFNKNITLKNKILNQSEFPSVISTSLVNLNILTVENRDLTNLKLFEIAASDGLLLSEYNSHSNNILEENKECYYYDVKKGNLNLKLESIFNKISNKELLTIKNTGYEVMQVENHSITNRVDTILSIIT